MISLLRLSCSSDIMIALLFLFILPTIHSFFHHNYRPHFYVISQQKASRRTSSSFSTSFLLPYDASSRRKQLYYCPNTVSYDGSRSVVREYSHEVPEELSRTKVSSAYNSLVSGRTRRRGNKYPKISNIIRMQKRLDTDDDDDDNTYDDEDSIQQLPRRRDMIKEWIYGSSGSNGNRNRNMIRPIRIDGSVIEDDEDDVSSASSTSQRVVKNTFGNLFTGMPSINEILGTNENQNFDGEQQQKQQQQLQQPQNQQSNIPRKKQSDTQDDSWFENERKQIIENYNDIFNSMLNQIANERAAQSNQNKDLQTSQQQPSSSSSRASTYSSSSKPSSQQRDEIPDNAEALIRSILKQEMENEINATKERMAKELLASYELEQMTKFLKSSTGSTDNNNNSYRYDYDEIPNQEKVQKLIDDSEKEYVQKEKSQLELDEFLKYEREAILNYKKTNDNSVTSTSEVLNDGVSKNPDSNLMGRPTKIKNEDDLDLWVLERFQQMIEMNEKRIGDDNNDDIDNNEGNENVLDNLENNLQELTERIQLKLNKRDNPTSSFDNVKDWQMYRSIATQLTNQYNAERGGGDDSGEVKPQQSNAEKKIQDENVLKILQSWKEYNSKEEQNRKLSGLSSIGPKLPFEWQEADLEERLQKRNIQGSGITSTTSDLSIIESNRKLSKNEIRKRINRMSIDAMESLIRSPTIDQTRKENLQKELDFLKATLEKNDYLDIDDIPENDIIDGIDNAGVIDNSKLFRPWTSSFDEEEGNENESDESSILSNYYDDNFSTSLPTTKIKAEEVESQPMDISPQRSDDKKTEQNSISQKQKRPPSTPFFTDPSGEDDDNSENEGIISTGGKLGSMEDQKLESMYRRAGAKTSMERALIKKQYEEFKEFEKTRRDESGLSGGDDTLETQLKYNISDVLLGNDGDFDANKILATIGPRPVRNKNINKTTKAEETNVNTLYNSVDQDEVIQSRYRAVSAVGGGRYKDDPEARAREQASYEEYLKKENQVRQSLESDDVDPDIIANIELPDRTNSTLLDDVKYAEEVIATLGSRPKPKRARIIQDEGAFSDNGGVLAFNDIDEDMMDDEDEDDSVDNENDSGVPEWLRKEQEEAKASPKKGRKSFLGSDLDEVFDDTDYEHNMRQLAEYERRRSGDSRNPMGIDISDVLGRSRSSMYQSDDYADYKYDKNDYGRIQGSMDDWGTGNFERRKQDLLDYIELDVRGINSLMDHKDSVHSTGVSQYQKRINKPFKEFGAIFRLEGVLIDISGLHLEAWTKVANDNNYKIPSFDDVRKASVTRAEVAVKDIFCWTEDFMECKNLARMHRDALRSAFDTWRNEAGIEISASDSEQIVTNRGFLVPDADIVDSRTPNQVSSNIVTSSSEPEKIELIAKAWTRTASAIDMPKPFRQEVLNAMLLSPDIAIKQIFRWSDDPLEIETVAQIYRNNLRLLNEGSIGGLQGSMASDSRPFSNTVTSQSSTSPVKKPFTQNEVMELSHQVWTEVAQAYNFEPPMPEESMAAFVINDPEITVRDGFGWTNDPRIISVLVKEFQQKLSALTSGVFKFESMSSSTEKSLNAIVPEAAGPSRDEIYEASRNAWLATAKRARLSIPDDEQILFAMSVGPEEAIRVGFQWAETNDETEILLAIYKSEIGKGRAKWTGGPKPRPQPPLEKVTQKTISPKGPNADDVFKTAFDSWTATAQKYGYQSPDQEQVVFALSVGPEDAVVSGFEWTRDTLKINELVTTYRQELSNRRSKWQKNPMIDSSTLNRKMNHPKVTIVSGSSEWIPSLLNKEMQCGIISYLDRDQVEILLKYSGLDKYFPIDKRVSATNNYRTDDDSLLGMALRLERRPDHCAVFDCTPYSSIAAHNVEMQSVTIIGIYPRYELLASDATTASFTDLTAMNIRRLFGERIYDQPLEEVQAIAQSTRKDTRGTTTLLNVDE